MSSPASVCANGYYNRNLSSPTWEYKQGKGPLRAQYGLLGDLATWPRYWIVPDWWIRNDIYKAHKAYLARHGGTRPGNPDSKHHAIDESRLKEWQTRWDILGVFE